MSMTLDAHREGVDKREHDIVEALDHAELTHLRDDFAAMFASTANAFNALSQGRVDLAMMALDDAGTRRAILANRMTALIEGREAHLYGSDTQPSQAQALSLHHAESVSALLGAYQSGLDALHTNYRELITR